jgi:hypothetical protein
MTDRESSYGTSPKPEPSRIGQRLQAWWRTRDPAEQFLAEASDLVDLERRMRALERASGGPVIVTFNH